MHWYTVFMRTAEAISMLLLILLEADKGSFVQKKKKKNTTVK